MWRKKITIFYFSIIKGGMAIGPVILINPKYRNDIGLHEHEKVHVRQFYRTYGLFPLLWLCSKKHRLKYEVEAYKKQLEYSPESLDTFARYLSRDYGLDISVKEARALLS